MRHCLTKITVILVILMFHLGVNSSTVHNRFTASVGSPSQNYTSHDPIRITNDSELATVANFGTGSVNDPYVLAGWNISGVTTGIFITETTKYFRIENCWIEDTDFCGIYVFNVSSGTTTIINNICNRNGDESIYLGYVNSSTVTKNVCNNNIYGISLSNAYFSTVTDNSCNNNSYIGIEVYHSDNNSIVWNSLRENGYGVVLSDNADNNSIHHNSFIRYEGYNDTQAIDHGRNNRWYDDTTLVGNYWSNCNGRSSYPIGGEAGAWDPYPAEHPFSYTTSAPDASNFISLLIRMGLLVFILGCLLVVFLLNRHRKSI